MVSMVLLGDGGVGKSSLVVQLVQNHFPEDIDPTIEDSYRYMLNVDGKQELIDVLDTAGQEEYSSMRDRYIRTGKVFLIVYSITNESSFASIPTYYEQILRVQDEEWYPMVLIGNKVDCEDLRVVEIERGKQLAEKLRIPFLETSAKTRYNVVESFVEAVRIASLDFRNYINMVDINKDRALQLASTLVNSPIQQFPASIKTQSCRMSLFLNTNPSELVSSFFCFSVCDRESFQYLDKFTKQKSNIKNKSKNENRILIGLDCDFRNFLQLGTKKSKIKTNSNSTLTVPDSSYFSFLSDELILRILFYLPSSSVKSIFFTCKRLAKISLDRSVSKIKEGDFTSFEEGKQLAKSLRCKRYYEVCEISALKKTINIEQLTINDIKKRQEKTKKPKKRFFFF